MTGADRLEFDALHARLDGLQQITDEALANAIRRYEAADAECDLLREALAVAYEFSRPPPILDP
jgi:hypothetical protein